MVKRQIEFDKQIGQFYIDEFIYGEFLTGGILSVILNWIQYGQQSIDDVSSDIVTMICGARGSFKVIKIKQERKQISH